MGRHIVVIEGHPDSAPERFCRVLADAYAEGATQAGHQVSRIQVARLDFRPLTTKAEFEGSVPEALRPGQELIRTADHLVVIYPLWLGSMPALLKAYFEQVFRPGFAFDFGGKGVLWRRKLRGKSARIVVTMGMPALFYRWYFGAHGLKSLERSILGFVGIGPVRETLIGLIESLPDAKRKRWIARMRALGSKGI